MSEPTKTTEAARTPAIDRPCTCSDPDTRYHSGQKECDRCWTIRKLDRPAAQHWSKALFGALSNIDMYDQMDFFPDAGLSKEEANTMIESMWKLFAYADKIRFNGVTLEELMGDEKSARITWYREHPLSFS